MLKILALAIIVFSTGCHHEPKVCPKIETLKPIAPIDVNVTIKQGSDGDIMCMQLDLDDGQICGTSAHNLFKWMKQMRKTTNYYEQEIPRYNKTFVDK